VIVGIGNVAPALRMPMLATTDEGLHACIQAVFIIRLPDQMNKLDQQAASPPTQRLTDAG
jgi:hypothetical protein